MPMEVMAGIAIAEVAIKALQAGAGMYRTWKETRGGGVAVTNQGATYQLSQPGRFDAAEVAGLAGRYPGRTVSFSGWFVPADDWAQQALYEDQPVLVVIEDLDDASPLDSVVAVTMLGDGFGGSLFPGVYRLSALVFEDDDPDQWSDETIVGGEMVDFEVSSDDYDIEFEIAIEAAVPIIDVVEGFVAAGVPAHYTVNLDGGLTYGVYVEPTDSYADLDLNVYDESGDLVAYDVDPDSDALCLLSTARNGQFTLEVISEFESARYRIILLQA